MALVVGLTGGIGSGKTTVEKLFAQLGAAAVDADVIARELTGPHGAAMPALARAFGPAVVNADGGLDRPAMRALAFADVTARQRLEAILHPMIRAQSEVRCREALAAGAAYAILTIPLLIESGDYRRRVDRVLVVDCDDETRIARVVARSGLARAEVERIMAAQCSRAERLTAADDIIDNNGDADTLKAQVANLHRLYLGLAADGRPQDR